VLKVLEDLGKLWNFSVRLTHEEFWKSMYVKCATIFHNSSFPLAPEIIRTPNRIFTKITGYRLNTHTKWTKMHPISGPRATVLCACVMNWRYCNFYDPTIFSGTPYKTGLWVSPK
jgi:hypothetical protein